MKGKTIAHLSSPLTVCTWVFLMALATRLFILFGVWGLCFSHLFQLYGASLLVTSYFFQTASLTLGCLFGFLNNLNHTSNPWEKGYLIKGKLFSTLSMRSSHSSPLGQDKGGGGTGKNKICLVSIFLKKIQGMPGRWKETKIYPPLYFYQRSL